MNKKSSLFLIAACLAFSVSTANASQYTFSQGEFDEGASISGSFVGNDANNDNLLTLTEISAFNLSFSGNSIVSSFTHTLADLSAFSFQLADNNTLGESGLEGLATRWFETTGFTYVSGVSTNGQQGAGIINWEASAEGDIFTESPNSISVNAVPVPGAIWLFGSVLIGFIGLKRRNV